ncbi:nucleotide pyrophosphohydrolase [Saprospiraceae bacterium]|nr:nucleotide pyrophosphohydrolase [Saprospiraceae bacterium]
MTIKEYQTDVDKWIKDIGVRYFSELTNMAILTEEVGELARHMSRTYGEQSYKIPLTDVESKQKISDEIADILFVTTCLANQMNINLEHAVKENMIKKTKRDSKRHLSNKKL